MGRRLGPGVFARDRPVSCDLGVQGGVASLQRFAPLGVVRHGELNFRAVGLLSSLLSLSFEENHRLRLLLPVVKRRNLVLIGDGGDESRGVELPEPLALALALESDRRRISSRIRSSETLRSELVGKAESSSHSVNFDEDIF